MLSTHSASLCTAESSAQVGPKKSNSKKSSLLGGKPPSHPVSCFQNPQALTPVPLPWPLRRSLSEVWFGKGLDLTLLSFLSLGFLSLLSLSEALKGPTLHFPHPRSNFPNSLQPDFHTPPRWNCPSKVPHPHWVLLTSLFSLEQPLGPQPHTAGLTYPCASSGLTTNEQLGREGRKPVHQALWTKGRGTNLPLKTPFSHCWSQGGCSLIIQEFFGSWQLCCSWVLRGGPWFCCRVL